MKTIATITGPTCSGKDHFLRYLREQGHKKLVSTTTRPKRPNEIEGEDYYFILAHQHEELVELDAFSQTVELSGYKYGVTFDEIKCKLAEDDVAFVIVEPGGVHQYDRIAKELGYRRLKIFVDTHPTVLDQRILERTVAALEGRSPMKADYVRGVLRHYKDVVTCVESKWIDVHEWDVILNGAGDPALNYTSVLAAYDKMFSTRGNRVPCK